MKVNVCFVPSSFNFNRVDSDLFESVQQAALLVQKMTPTKITPLDFIKFSASSDFYEYVANELFSSGKFTEIGPLSSAIYDGEMGKVKQLNGLCSTDIINLINEKNNTTPDYEDRWLSIYSPLEITQKIDIPEREISDENDLVSYCSDVLVKNPRNHRGYSISFPQIYKNLLFLDYPDHTSFKTFDNIRKIEGGYVSFIKGITDCLTYMNAYEVIPNDSQKNIANLNASLDFSVTPEGKGKNKRTIKALKRDFLIDDIKYENINCEYHYKLERVDNANGNGTYFFNRIYFGFFNRIEPDNPKIAIAHIGEHL